MSNNLSYLGRNRVIIFKKIKRKMNEVIMFNHLKKIKKKIPSSTEISFNSYIFRHRYLEPYMKAIPLSFREAPFEAKKAMFNEFNISDSFKN